MTLSFRLIQILFQTGAGSLPFLNSRAAFFAAARDFFVSASLFSIRCFRLLLLSRAGLNAASVEVKQQAEQSAKQNSESDKTAEQVALVFGQRLQNHKQTLPSLNQDGVFNRHDDNYAVALFARVRVFADRRDNRLNHLVAGGDFDLLLQLKRVERVVSARPQSLSETFDIRHCDPWKIFDVFERDHYLIKRVRSHDGDD
jgi:hypothetical protein